MSKRSHPFTFDEIATPITEYQTKKDYLVAKFSLNVSI